MEDMINLTSLASQVPMKKMIARLLVPLSIFSLAFSYSFWYFENSHYFSSNSFHLIMNKNCIFFICNGLLVFLAKTSGFVLSPPSSDFDPNDMLQKRIVDGLEMVLETKLPDQSLLEKDHVTTTLMDQESGHEISKEEERAEEEVSIFIAESSDDELGVENDDQNESNNCLPFHDEEEQEHEQEEQEQEQEQEVYDDEDEEEDQVYGQEEEEKEKLEMLSTEELNKKFEDFIRKMKEEIRISEVRHQLLMVN